MKVLVDYNKINCTIYLIIIFLYDTSEMVQAMDQGAMNKYELQKQVGQDEGINQL